MSIFEGHAQYYDVFNREKDYEAECDFLEEIFHKYAQKPVQTILDLGCGTGGHAIPLRTRGYRIVGVDASAEMIGIARGKVDETNASLEFLEGDARKIRLGRKFDAVVSMFAVVVYMLSNGDLSTMFETARKHLHSGGLFTFDCWYGPTVLANLPNDSTRLVDLTDGERLTRFVHPEVDVDAHRVTLNYTVTRSMGQRVIDRTDEVHPLRFLFPEEVQSLLKASGFELVRLCPFRDLGGELSTDDWYMSAIARATG